MRITNKIMQNNTLRNINTNKELQDKLNNQMATGNKVLRPSDDPVVAIRSLRLSTNATKLAQYNEKNAADAESWMHVTEQAIASAEGVVSGIYKECEKGCGDDMNTTNYQAILTTIKQARDEFYDNGNEDYEGRNLFTGYRTESKLTFLENESVDYKITQEFTLDDVQTRTNIDTNDVFDYTEANGFTADETKVVSKEFQRIRLAYDNLNQKQGKGTPKLTYTNAAGAQKTIDLAVKKSTEAGAYAPGDNEAYLLYDTGEIILGKNRVSEMSALPNTKAFTLTYEKSDWSKGDLRPEHYFDCTVTKDGPAGKQELKYESGSKQKIKYDLGYNQRLQVNTSADEIFVHDLGRDIDDLEVMINQLAKMDDIVASLEEKTGELADAQLKAAEKQLAAAKKAQAMIKDTLQKTFGSTMTTMQGYESMAAVALTGVGSRGARLDLIENRLSAQQETFDELLVKNNHKEIEESTSELASARLTYDAALSAMSEIIKTSLMNYI